MAEFPPYEVAMMPEPTTRSFRIPRVRSVQPVHYVIGGVFFFAVALVGFLIALFGRQGQASLHLMSTLPAIVSVHCWLAAWQLRRCPEEITVSAEGLGVNRRNARSLLAWDAIGWVSQGENPLTHAKHLTVYDVKGKLVARIPSALEGYQELAAFLQRHVVSQDAHRAERIRLRKARRMAIGTMAFSLLFLAGGVMFWFDARRQLRDERLLAESGVMTEAPIVRRFLAPDGVTTRVEFEVPRDAGEPVRHNVEITDDYYEKLAEQTHVSILAVPGFPSATRLVEGAVIDRTDTPRSKYLFVCLAALLGFGGMAASVMFWRGLDFVLDPQTKTYGFRRIGEVRGDP